MDKTTTTSQVVKETDTVYVEKKDTVWQTEYIPGETKYRPQYDTVYLDGAMDTVYIYQDTVKLDSVEVIYKAEVTGKIKNITFGVVNKYPVVTNTVTKTITNTEKIYPDSWYAGFYANTHSTGLHITRTLDRHMITLGYGTRNTVHLQYGYRFK